MNRDENNYISNIKITFDPNDVSMIIGPKVTPNEGFIQPRIKDSNDVMGYSHLFHTTDLSALYFILNKQTLRSSSLTNAKLNDPMEKARVGVSNFAGSRFISCFAHIENEIELFWNDYGGTDLSKKVMLKFKNFTDDLENVFYTDYCLIEDDKKVFFETPENIQASIRNRKQLLESNYVLTNFISSMEMFDIEYLKDNHEDFTKDYSSQSSLDFTNIPPTHSYEKPPIIENLTTFEPECLGRQKQDKFASEKETRILSCLNFQEFNDWAYIDLRLKDELFGDLVIIKSPCEDSDLEKTIQSYIDSSGLSPDIKKSISIISSNLKNTWDC